jgi:hypothetical protein
MPFCSDPRSVERWGKTCTLLNRVSKEEAVWRPLLKQKYNKDVRVRDQSEKNRRPSRDIFFEMDNSWKQLVGWTLLVHSRRGYKVETWKEVYKSELVYRHRCREDLFVYRLTEKTWKKNFEQHQKSSLGNDLTKDQ